MLVRAGRAVVDGVDVEVGLVITDEALFAGTSDAAVLLGYGPIPAQTARDLLNPTTEPDATDLDPMEPEPPDTERGQNWRTPARRGQNWRTPTLPKMAKMSVGMRIPILVGTAGTLLPVLQRTVRPPRLPRPPRPPRSTSALAASLRASVPTVPGAPASPAH